MGRALTYLFGKEPNPQPVANGVEAGLHEAPPPPSVKDSSVFSFIAPDVTFEGAISAPESDIIVAGKLLNSSIICRNAVILSTGEFIGDINCSGVLRIYGKVKRSTVRADDVFLYEAGAADDNTTITARRVGSQIGASLKATVHTTTGNAITPFNISDDGTEQLI